MTLSDLVPLLPLLFVGGGAVAVLIQVSIRRSRFAGTTIAVLSLIAALFAVGGLTARGPATVTTLFTVDGQTLWYQAVLLVCGLAVVLLMDDWLRATDEPVEEAQVLVLLTTLGGCLLAGATHFAMVFLGLELLSVALYPLVAYVRKDDLGIEAAMKYLVLAAASTGFFVFGAALVYAATGELGLHELAVGTPAPEARSLLQVGVAMVLVGLGFKLAVVPFHLWTPDVYQGAPSPVTALVATVSKGSVVAVLARWVLETEVVRDPTFVIALGGMAGASMLAGNLLALLQGNVKRLLAYSSIAQVGYLLVALIAGGTAAAGAVGFYVGAYTFTSIVAFGVVSVVSHRDQQAEDLAAWRGMFWEHPWLAGLFTTALLSLAGVPLTAGFVGKLLVLGTGVAGANWVLVALLVVGSAIGAFYYLRVVATMFVAPSGEPVGAPSRSAAAWVPIAGAAVLVLGLGLDPGPAVRWFAGW